MMFAFMACFLKLSTVFFESVREQDKKRGKATEAKEVASGQQERVKALEQKLEMWGKMWEDNVMDKVTKGADLAASSAKPPNAIPATSQPGLMSTPLGRSVIRMMVTIPFAAGLHVSGLPIRVTVLTTVTILQIIFFADLLVTILQPLHDRTKVNEKVKVAAKQNAAEANGVAESVKTLEGKIDEMNKRLKDQEMAASELALSSTMPRNTTPAESQNGLISAPLWVVIIGTPITIASAAYLYTDGVYPAVAIFLTVMASLIPLCMEHAKALRETSRLKSKPETKGVADDKKQVNEQTAVVECIKALEDKINGMGKSMESNMEAMEKRLVKDTEKLRNDLESCIEAEADDLQAILEETFTDQLSAQNDVMRMRLEKKVSVVVKGMEGRMRKWSQEKLSELNEKVTASLEAKSLNQREERSNATSEMPKRLTGLTEQLELALENEWKGVGLAKPWGTSCSLPSLVWQKSYQLIALQTSKKA